MAEVVSKVGVKREGGYLYFLRGSDVWKTPMKRAGGPAVEVLNFSVPGHAPGQRWEDFRRIGWEMGPDLVIYEAKGDNPVKNSTKRYQNHYIFFAYFRDGKIARWVEYSNPKVYEAATSTD